jgi:hypothetical protein
MHLYFKMYVAAAQFRSPLTISYQSRAATRFYICGGREKVGKSNNFKNELTRFTP